MNPKEQSIEVGKFGEALYVRVNLLCTVTKEKEGIYSGYCPALDVASQGDDEDEARQNIENAINLFIEACLEAGTLTQVLQEADFKKRAVEKKASSRSSNIKIPAFLPFATVSDRVSIA